jgi:hypothetical protein
MPDAGRPSGVVCAVCVQWIVRIDVPAGPSGRVSSELDRCAGGAPAAVPAVNRARAKTTDVADRY